MLALHRTKINGSQNFSSVNFLSTVTYLIPKSSCYERFHPYVVSKVSLIPLHALILNFIPIIKHINFGPSNSVTLYRYVFVACTNFSYICTENSRYVHVVQEADTVWILKQILMPEPVIYPYEMHTGLPSTNAGPSCTLYPLRKSFWFERRYTMATGSYDNGFKTILMTTWAHFAQSHLLF